MFNVRSVIYCVHISYRFSNFFFIIVVLARNKILIILNMIIYSIVHAMDDIVLGFILKNK